MQRTKKFSLIILSLLFVATIFFGTNVSGEGNKNSLVGENQHQKMNKKDREKENNHMRGTGRRLSSVYNPREGKSYTRSSFSSFQKKKGANFGGWADKTNKFHNEKARDKKWMKEQMNIINHKKKDTKWIKEQMDTINQAKQVMKKEKNKE